ncbi:hypothetical protein PV797_19945 [Clostridiaceae bacterium M8S5]|nr:hypothetical protein PV797_19945 [Clostridiaceae bacterium M8S5]
MKKNLTTIIAKIVSLYYLITGIGFFVSSSYYETMIAHKGSDPILINLSGMVHFFIGITILVLHFKWKKFIEIAVSLSGILFLMKGIFLIALPSLTLQASSNPTQIPWAMSIGFITTGSLIGYFAYFKGDKNENK